MGITHSEEVVTYQISESCLRLYNICISICISKNCVFQRKERNKELNNLVLKNKIVQYSKLQFKFEVAIRLYIEHSFYKNQKCYYNDFYSILLL